MENCTFCNANGDFLIVPQKGWLWITTECGKLQVSPDEVVILPQRFRFALDLPNGPSCGYVVEVFSTHFQPPDLGLIGANGLASPRDFLVPTVSFEQESRPSYTIIQKFPGELFTAKQNFPAFNVVAWHRNYVPYKFPILHSCRLATTKKRVIFIGTREHMDEFRSLSFAISSLGMGDRSRFMNKIFLSSCGSTVGASAKALRGKFHIEDYV